MAKKTIDEIALEVIDGKWGSGAKRKASLLQAGYNYNKVQERINEILSLQIAEDPQKYNGELPIIIVINDKVEISQADKLIKTAQELAWPAKTKASVYHYPKGSATSAFKKALDKYYPSHDKWSAKPSKGVSCDVFAGTCVRASGIDINFPRGLDEQVKYSSKKFKRIVKTNVIPINIVKPGDIVMYYRPNGSLEHVLIYGNKCIYEAQYHKENYGHTTTSLSKLRKKKSKVVILRPLPITKTVKRSYLKEGDKGAAVAEWQTFLEWYFDTTIWSDKGTFDSLTTNFSKRFQEEQLGQDAGDGLVGEKTLAIAALVKK